jgi:hypothetical protein
MDILSPTCRVQDSGCLCGQSRGSLFTHVSIANITSANIPLKLVQSHSTIYQLVFTSSADATLASFKILRHWSLPSGFNR